MFSSYTSHISRKHPGNLFLVTRGLLCNNVGKAAADCYRVVEAIDHTEEDNSPSMEVEAEVEFEAHRQEDDPPLLELECGAQSEFNSVQSNSTTEQVHYKQMQLQMAAASFLLTLKEKYKVKNVTS